MLLAVRAKRSMRTRTWPSASGWSAALCRRLAWRSSLRTSRVSVLIRPTLAQRRRRRTSKSPAPVTRATGGRALAPKRSGDREIDVDVAAGGVGVRADLVRGLDQLLLLRLVQARQRDRQLDGDAVGLAFVDRAQRDAGVDGDVVRHLDADLRADRLHRADEAGGIADRE